MEMHSLWPRIESLLAGVSKPARYIGCEEGAQLPLHSPESISWLLVYPDAYEIGLPNQGLQILYEILNEHPFAVAERAYAPWIDMEALMRAEGLPLFSLENHYSAASFDVLAFNLSAELTYTNVLNLIDLSGIPVRSGERCGELPLVVAGGHCAFNPEPLADFIDLFVLGDGEEPVVEITECLLYARQSRLSRQETLISLAGIEGVYVPSLYEVVYRRDGLIESVRPNIAGVRERVEKRTVADLAEWPYPKHQLVPLTEVVHDRMNVEVFRGCTRGCRFCQAGMITRPVRERPVAQVRQMVSEGLARTGYDEVALTSLSSADFSGIEQSIGDIIGDPMCSGQVSVSLPSLRVDAFTVGIASEIQKVRRTGLTFAPEGGTWRMRQVINKLISEDDLFGAVEAAFSQGWRRIKLYFLIGLPTEQDEDVIAIAELAKSCVEIGLRYHRNPTVTASVGGFVPKPHTPFQWFGQNSADELRRKVGILLGAVKGVRQLTLRWHDPEASLAEGIASRGDRRVGAVLEHVWRHGGTFQEWSERFELKRWTDAMQAVGLSVEDVVYRERFQDEVLPWDHLSSGLHRDFLWGEWQDALVGAGQPDCRWTPCYDCGVCTGYGLEHVVASALPPAGGSQGTLQVLPSPPPTRIPLHIAPPSHRVLVSEVSAKGQG